MLLCDGIATKLHTMKTIQVVMDEPLLKRLDSAAACESVARSALVRDAVARLLAERDLEELERQDREAYLAMPMTDEEAGDWSKVQAWPDDWREE